VNLTKTCRICQNRENHRTFTAREMMFGLRDEFTYFECPKCGCVQIAEVPSQLENYYPPNYYSFQKAGWLKSVLKRCWASYSYHDRGLIGRSMALVMGKNQAIESVKRAGVPKGAALLDVGCGSGDLLLLLHSLGFTNLAGADPFLAKDIVYENGVKVWRRELSEFSEKFDVIMLHHSFEHMTNPTEVIRQSARLLNPGGVLIIRVPVAGSYAWRTYGVNWVQLDPPRHVFLPSVASMKILAELTGLRLGEVVHESNEFQFWGSEQYQRDIPLLDSRSLAPLWKQALAHFKMKQYRARAFELNRKGEGDSACFYLHDTGGITR
jgi:SAM-dependent methyltransferase